MHLRDLNMHLRDLNMHSSPNQSESKVLKQAGKGSHDFLSSLNSPAKDKINAYEVVMGDQSSNKSTHRALLLPYLLRIDTLGGHAPSQLELCLYPARTVVTQPKG